MIDPLSASAIVGIGWAAKKILGPSLDEIGSQLKSYSSTRIAKILTRVNEKDVRPELISAVPNAFALRFFQSASMSEDDEAITELWANLLVNTAISFDSRKLLYLDILDKISPSDAALLNDLIPADRDLGLGYSVRNELQFLETRLHSLAERLLESAGLQFFDQARAEEFNDSLKKSTHRGPLDILQSEVPFAQPKRPGLIVANRSSVGLIQSVVLYDPLIRQRLVQEFSLRIEVGGLIKVGGVMATDLGIEFLHNCRGVLQ